MNLKIHQRITLNGLLGIIRKWKKNILFIFLSTQETHLKIILMLNSLIRLKSYQPTIKRYWFLFIKASSKLTQITPKMNKISKESSIPITLISRNTFLIKSPLSETIKVDTLQFNFKIKVTDRRKKKKKRKKKTKKIKVNYLQKFILSRKNKALFHLQELVEFLTLNLHSLFKLVLLKIFLL